MTARELHARLAGGESAEVLGLRLVPLTIGHVRLMDFLGCSDMRNPEEVALCVLVCSRPQGKVLAFLRWFLPVKLLIWKLYLGAWEPVEARKRVLEYIQRHTELPFHIVKGESGPACPIPGHQMIRTRLISQLGYRPESVDGTPFLQALWDLRTLDVMRGSVEMMDYSTADLEVRTNAINWDAVRATGEQLLRKNAK